MRARNRAAKADATEQRVMEGWANAPLGEDGKPRRWTAHEGDQYRYMRAIPTMPMCLACHGENIAPEVTAAIRANYPGDQATGFAPGQLRGAFSICWDEAALSRAIRKGETAQ
ncbi:Tll0287-like domain-containing protein [Novosphingobium panipatense]|uniref:Tll0287-like domain-containing protein n=1 Tax=Novosphingobium panipatense TaxID=428991 RepID=UPI003620875E